MFRFLAPMGTTFHCMGPSGGDVAVHGLKSSCNGIWWYPCFRSNTVKMRFFCCFCGMESISSNQDEACSVCLFQYSVIHNQSHSPSAFFGTMKAGLAHSQSDDSIQPLSINFIKSFLIASALSSGR